MKKAVSLWLSFLLILASACVSATELAAPHLFQTSGCAMPGEVLMLYGSGFGADASVLLCPIGQSEGQTVTPGYMTETCIGITVPSVMEPSGYSVCVYSGGLASEMKTVNLPEVDWVMGDTGETAAAGGCFTIIGSGFIGTNAPRVYLADAQNQYNCTVTSYDAYRIEATAVNVAAGTYTVSVETDYGTSEVCGSLTLTAQTTDTVQTFTPAAADIDASGTKDSTAGIQAALNSAGTAGGGVVTVPRGRYKLSSVLTIPAGVILSGAAREHTSLYWVAQATGNPSMITAAENAALRDVSISVSGSYGDVISAVSGFSMTNVTLRASAYFHHATQGKIGGTYSGPSVSEKPYQLGSVLAAEGSGIRVTDCDIYATAVAFDLDNASYVKIENTDVRFGVRPFTMTDCQKVLLCGNSFSGTSLYENDAIVGESASDTGIRDVYFAHNSFSDFYGGNRRALTLSSQSAVQLAEGWSAAAETLTVANTETAQLKPDYAVLVASGKGEGQCVNIASVSGNVMQLQTAWTVVPDATSVLLLVPQSGRMVLYDNTFTDAGTAVYAAGGLVGADLADNTFIRTAPLTGSGGAFWYNTLSGNVTEAGYRWGGMDENAVLGSEDGDTFLRGNVLRGNTMRGNGSICLLGEAVDTLLENNLIQNVDTGMILPNISRAYLVGNQFENVTTPYRASTEPEAAVSDFASDTAQLLIEPLSHRLTVWFDLPMDASTLTNANITARTESGLAVPLVCTALSAYACRILPQSGAWEENTAYTLLLGDGVRDVFGGSLRPRQISFTTAAHSFETQSLYGRTATGAPLTKIGTEGAAFSLCLKNAGTAPQEVSLYLAFYDAEGRLLWTGRAQNTLAADAQDTLTVTAKALPTGAETARLFTWSDSRPMQLVREMTVKQ